MWKELLAVVNFAVKQKRKSFSKCTALYLHCIKWQSSLLSQVIVTKYQTKPEIKGERIKKTYIG